MKGPYLRQFARMAAGVVIALGMSSAAFAQDPLEERLQRLEKQNEEIRKNAEALQKQNEALLKLLNTGSAPVSTNAPLNVDDVKGIVSGYLQERQAKQQADTAAVADPDGRYKIGSDLRMSATWKNGVVLSTPNNDFSLHIGGWIQYDNVWWDESRQLQTAKSGTNAGPAQKVLSGPALGGIGSLEDGTYFRRIRLQTDGKFWENYEYTLTLAMENDQFDTIGLDEFWVGMTNIPLIGTVRMGHVKNAIGLEGDMSASSKVMTFMERSSYSEAIERNENFVTGLWLGNAFLDQRTTYSATIFRSDQAAASGVYFGNDQWGAQGRWTALPLYQNDGRCLLHLGLSGGWRSGQGTGGVQTVQLRARPELRDDDPAAQTVQPVPNANDNRMIDTGAILCQNDWLIGTELLWIWGPLSVQGEYGRNIMQDATGANNALPGKVLLAAPQNYVFNGGYLQLAYTLTGENRSYDKRLGRLDSYYFGRQGNFNNFWFVRDEDGRLNWNFGAWEVAARLSYTDLNAGRGLAMINGGEMTGLTLGLNWYLNDTVKLQFDYVFDDRHNVPGLAGGTPTTSTQGGTTRGVGMRMQMNY
jgi:phosphate-selective porin OprO/OprP